MAAYASTCSALTPCGEPRGLFRQYRSALAPGASRYSAANEATKTCTRAHAREGQIPGPWSTLRTNAVRAHLAVCLSAMVPPWRYASARRCRFQSRPGPPRKIRWGYLASSSRRWGHSVRYHDDIQVAAATKRFDRCHDRFYCRAREVRVASLVSGGCAAAPALRVVSNGWPGSPPPWPTGQRLWGPGR